MRRVLYTSIILTLLAVAGVPRTLSAQTEEYKEYTPTNLRVPYFTISFDKEMLWIGFPGDSTAVNVAVRRSTLDWSGAKVTADGKTLFDERGVTVGDSICPYDLITDLAVSQHNTETIIDFYTGERARQRGPALRRGNRITFDRNISIAADEFVRGVIFTAKGNIDVAGEANKDVISLFGNINVTHSAVIRGDVVSIAGNITMDKTASIYGDTYSGVKNISARKHRFARKQEEFSGEPTFSYNRVDGFAPFLTLKYEDADSLLPTVWAKGGYAFGSGRWRFDVGMEQMLWRKPALALGGNFYRRLASDDDWIIGDVENSAFAFLVKEDFKDFYQAEGGSVYLKVAPLPNTKVELRLQGEETDWQHAHRHLWSLFGGDKLFPENYRSIDSVSQLQKELISRKNAAIMAEFEYDSRNRENLFGHSAWRGFATLEWSDSAFGSDFNYRKYLLGIRRYQRTTRYTMLLLNGTYGASDGDLPLYKEYSLGGIGTLYGYKQKEYMGTRFWMANAEYRFAFPKSDLAFSLFWDIGQIAAGTSFDQSSQVRNSLGIAFYVGNTFRLSIARRLDRSFDNSPKIYARIGNVF